MSLFKEYGTETMSRIHKILELEKPVIIDFSDVEDEFSAYGDVYWDWVEGTLDFIRAVAEERKVYIFMDGETEVSCRVSKYDVDPKTRDWSLRDELFGYSLVGGFTELINLDSDFGDKEFDNFICLCYRLREDENIDDWDENDEVWDYYIEEFGECIPDMKHDLDETINNMQETVSYIERIKSELHSSCESYLEG